MTAKGKRRKNTADENSFNFALIQNKTSFLKEKNHYDTEQLLFVVAARHYEEIK